MGASRGIAVIPDGETTPANSGNASMWRWSESRADVTVITTARRLRLPALPTAPSGAPAAAVRSRRGYVAANTTRHAAVLRITQRLE